MAALNAHARSLSHYRHILSTATTRITALEAQLRDLQAQAQQARAQQRERNNHGRDIVEMDRRLRIQELELAAVTRARREEAQETARLRVELERKRRNEGLCAAERGEGICCCQSLREEWGRLEKAVGKVEGGVVEVEVRPPLPPKLPREGLGGGGGGREEAFGGLGQTASPAPVDPPAITVTSPSRPPTPPQNYSLRDPHLLSPRLSRRRQHSKLASDPFVRQQPSSPLFSPSLFQISNPLPSPPETAILQSYADPVGAARDARKAKMKNRLRFAKENIAGRLQGSPTAEGGDGHRLEGNFGGSGAGSSQRWLGGGFFGAEAEDNRPTIVI